MEGGGDEAFAWWEICDYMTVIHVNEDQMGGLSLGNAVCVSDTYLLEVNIKEFNSADMLIKNRNLVFLMFPY